MLCKYCVFGDICKYRDKCEEILERNIDPYYIKDDKGDDTPLRQSFTCDRFVFLEEES